MASGEESATSKEDESSEVHSLLVPADIMFRRYDLRLTSVAMRPEESLPETI